MTIRLDHLMQLADRAMMGVPHVNASESLLLLRYLTDEQREHARICYATLIGERTVPLEFNAGRARPAVSPAMRRAPLATRAPRPAPYNRNAVSRAAAARRKLEAMRDLENE